jgi:hypothetical protein
LRGLGDTRADRKWEGEKNFCCVTTRGSNFGAVNDLERGLGSASALFLCLGMATSSRGILAMLGLAPRRLPTTDFPLTFPVLTVTLVPTPRHVFAITPFAQASSLPRSALPSQAPALYFNVSGAHGSCNSQGKSSGRMCLHSPRALSKRERDTYLLAGLRSALEQDSEVNDLKYALRTRVRTCPELSDSLRTFGDAADSMIGSRLPESWNKTEN